MDFEFKLVLESKHQSKQYKQFMQQDPSSSTLHNYISSGDNEDSSRPRNIEGSSCIKCQNINQLQNRQDSSSDSDSSSHDDGQLVQPLHRHIVQHTREIQTTIKSLQIQVEKLKKNNHKKDLLIDQLTKQLKNAKNATPNHLVQQGSQDLKFQMHHKQIQGIRRQINQNAYKMMNNKNFMLNTGPNIPSGKTKRNDGLSGKDLKQRVRNIEIKFEDRNYRVDNKSAHNKNVQARRISYVHNISAGSSSRSQSRQQSASCQKVQMFHKSSHHGLNKHKNRGQSNVENAPKQKNRQIKTKNKNQGNQSLQINIEDELSLQMQKVQRLQKHVRFCEDQMLWMSNFIIAFLKMGEKIMFLFRQPVMRPHWDLKKKSKIAWQYFKHVFSYLID